MPEEAEIQLIERGQEKSLGKEDINTSGLSVLSLWFFPGSLLTNMTEITIFALRL